MGIALITITHNRIGAEILHTATQIFGEPPIASRHFAVHAGIEPAELSAGLAEVVDEVDSGDGVLLLTDLFGSTPCNVAHAHDAPHQVRVVTGLNLPMVLRIYNYAHLDLAAIAETAANGGQRGILARPARPGPA